MRGRLIVAGLVVTAALAGAAACGLDESGAPADATADVSPIEGGPSDAPVDVVQGCETLDATACVPTGLPSGWTWAVVALDDESCPQGDYQTSKYLYALGLEAGACTCGCTTSGSYSCAGQVEAGTTPGCTGKVISFDAGDDATCVDTEWNDPHIAYGPLPQVSGAPTCTANAGGSRAFTAQTATACAPGCTIDYCGVDAGSFKRCIIASGSEKCPDPFTLSAPTLGPADKVSVQCGACGCSVDPPAACSATVSASNASDCSNPFNATVPPNTCATPDGSTKVNSFLYVPTVPKPSCAADGGAGSASFASSVTVCCLP